MHVCGTTNLNVGVHNTRELQGKGISESQNRAKYPMNNPIRAPIGNPIGNPTGNPRGNPIGNPKGKLLEELADI